MTSSCRVIREGRSPKGEPDEFYERGLPGSTGTDQDIQACRKTDIKAIQESILNLDLFYQHFHAPAVDFAVNGQLESPAITHPVFLTLWMLLMCSNSSYKDTTLNEGDIQD